MSTSSKVLIGLIIVAVLPLFVLSLLVLTAHREWRGRATAMEAEIQKLRQESERLAEGEDGIRKHESDIFPLIVGRGHVWRGQVQQIDPNQRLVNLALPEGGASQIAKETTLFAFEDGRNAEGNLVSSRYLGEFRVMDIAPDGKLIQLRPVHLNLPVPVVQLPQPIPQLNQSWALYENMPVDTHEAFAGLDDKQLGAMLPAASLAEYRKHGKRAEPGDPQERVVDGNYVRMLRDYDSHFREMDRQWAVLVDATASAQNDVAQLAAAQAEVEKTIASFQTEKQELTQERELMFAERDQVQQYRDALEQRLANGRKEIARLLEQNRQLSEQLAARQRAAAVQIDGRGDVRQASRN
jgi:hypothetical protein